MIKISQVVTDILNGDEVALEALRSGILNLSAFATNIQPQVEKRLFKEVKIGSIVTALSRMSQRMVEITPLRVPVRLEDMSIKSPLSELTYEMSKEVSQKVAKLIAKYAGKGFFTSTQGIGEVTLIVPQSLRDDVLNQVGIKPRGQYNDLSAVTVRFTEQEYLEIPNMIYTFVAVLASRRINLIEIVSTYTEISFIVRQRDMKATVEVLKDNFLS